MWQAGSVVCLVGVLHKARQLKINNKFVLKNKEQCNVNYRDKNEHCMLDQYYDLRSEKHKI